MLKPYYESEDGDVRLFLADCLEVLPTLEAGSVDAVVTDPPYGIGFKYASHNDSPEGYGQWLWSIIEQAESKCEPGSPIFIWQAQLNIRRAVEWFPRQWRIFAACKNFVQIRPTPMQYAFDPVIVWWTEGEVWSEGTNSRDWHVGNTANTLNRGEDDAGSHPCARPLNTLLVIIGQWARPNGTVLDPFMGSGTTGVACVKLGRKFIGIEIEEKYCEIAAKRIIEAKKQGQFEFEEGK